MILWETRYCRISEAVIFCFPFDNLSQRIVTLRTASLGRSVHGGKGLLLCIGRCFSLIRPIWSIGWLVFLTTLYSAWIYYEQTVIKIICKSSPPWRFGVVAEDPAFLHQLSPHLLEIAWHLVLATDLRRQDHLGLLFLCSGHAVLGNWASYDVVPDILLEIYITLLRISAAGTFNFVWFFITVINLVRIFGYDFR